MKETENPRIAVVGSLNMDLVVSTVRLPRIGETVEGSSIHYIPGGKGANQAVGCARLGASAHMVGAVGEDPFGDDILKVLDKYGVNTEAIDRIEGTSTGTATILRTGEDNCIVIVSGANGFMEPEMVERQEEVIRTADLLLVQLEIPTESVHRALSLAKSSGVRTILNPAPARQLTAELLELCDYITPNETEFLELSCKGSSMASEDFTDEDWSSLLAEWEQRFDNKVILTRGSRGASYMESGRLRTVPAPKIEVVDTTGAGDCLNAALGYSLASGMPLYEALVFAVKAASISVTRFGAQAGMPTIEQIQGL
ncbi:ribokinase [Paenibacillus sp. D2_2]|uniref:ribokinase n=1 Tax=Paenibacillus sp. D2_2 TaxID=3073092 RepID=UPI002815B9F1|nr:ribokinase [Paenibacillus sp. D2_2]WMT39444.1 ribokinase [Paenibacillus sp. D2_2]